MDDSLTKDEFAALAEIQQAKKGERPSACMARNTKKLIGLKYIAHRKDGALILTEKGQQILFVRRCIDGLRATANAVPVDADVAAFLSRKGLIAPKASAGGFEITERGRESLAEIDARENKTA